MKQLSLIFISGIIALNAYSQELNFKVKGVNDTTVYLIKYIGNKLFYADTARLVNEKVSFDGSKQQPGILGVLMPEQQYFEFIYNNENVSIETAAPNYSENIVVKESKENKVFIGYINYMRSQQNIGMKLQEEINSLDESQQEKKDELKKKLDGMGKEVLEYQNKLIAENEGLLASKIILMSSDLQIPEVPEDQKDNELFAYEYFRDHFFDNIDLTDDRLVNTPVIQNKLEYYYSDRMLMQQPDTILKYMYKVIDQIPPSTEMYKLFVTNVTSHFEKSPVMGMDKVWNSMVARYFCSTNEKGELNAFWADPEKIKTLCKDTKIRLKLVVGEIPPNLILTDSTEQKWHSLYDIEADYTVLYFWDPGCGHCKTVTPQLGELYTKKIKDRNVEIYAIGKATGDDFKDWKDFIRKHNLTFINVGVTPKIYDTAKENPHSIIPSKTTLESINYQETYDIYATPRVFVLDKDKKIIAKSLSVGQLEHFLDDVQGMQDAEKLFELEEPHKEH